jgi:hypothetical protein
MNPFTATGYPIGAIGKRSLVSITPMFPTDNGDGSAYVSVSAAMTPDQARELAAQLLAAADKADGPEVTEVQS